jgi:class 3 adenylate cyclase
MPSLITGRGSVALVGVILVVSLGASSPAPAGPPVAAPQPMTGMAGGSMDHPPTPFYREWTFHVLLGLVAASAGFLVYRARSRRHWRRAPAGVMSEAVLVVDLVDSTRLATHHGDGLAMRARNVMEERTLAAGKAHGATVVDSTGDGCMMTFPSVRAAVEAAVLLLRGLRDHPPDLAPVTALDVRAGVTYGEILLDSHGTRHGATINKAFRLIGVSSDAFAQVEGEDRLGEVPDRNRIFADEEAVNELSGAVAPFRFLGFCRLKGFTGLHRVYQILWDARE